MWKKQIGAANHRIKIAIRKMTKKELCNKPVEKQIRAHIT